MTEKVSKTIWNNQYVKVLKQSSVDPLELNCLPKMLAKALSVMLKLVCIVTLRIFQCQTLDLVLVPFQCAKITKSEFNASTLPAKNVTKQQHPLLFQQQPLVPLLQQLHLQRHPLQRLQ